MKERIAYCKLCGRKFTKLNPNNSYCSKECSSQVRKEAQKAYQKKRYIPNKNKAMKTCKICGQILPDARQKYCESCLLEISVSTDKKSYWAKQVLRCRGIDKAERTYLLNSQ